MSRFYTSIIIYSLVIIGLAVGLSGLLILRPLKADLAQVSQDQTDLKQELTTDLADIKQSLVSTNQKLDRLPLGSTNPTDDLSATGSAVPADGVTADLSAARRLAKINAAIDTALTDLNPTPQTSAVGGLQRQITISSSQWHQIELYESPNPSALTIGNIRWGTNYPVVDSQPTGTNPQWYQVTIPGGTRGWVMAIYVKEIQ